MDVVVCDGFVGNSVLKASEGVAKMIVGFLRQEFSRNLLRKLSALIAMPVLKALRARMDPGNYNGASLLGLKGIVIKSHGSADRHAFGQALRRAVEVVRNDVVRRISEQHGQGAHMIFSRIVGTGSYLPPRVVSNDELSKRVDTSDAWIQERTGITAAPHRRQIAGLQRPRAGGEPPRAGGGRHDGRRTSTSSSSPPRRPISSFRAPPACCRPSWA